MTLDGPHPSPAARRTSRRVAALLTESRANSRPFNVPLLPLAATAAVIGASALCAFAAVHDLHVLLELAGSD
ncbi:hypothetical protein [Streptomyces naganishii]|uniref:hypothetical protein n=1 Tax=Streptomyces naganishii TaxID=285447 RepID=UPI00167DAD53|nr:hypothetical protein [Streptomyces naganishii]